MSLLQQVTLIVCQSEWPFKRREHMKENCFHGRRNCGKHLPLNLVNIISAVCGVPAPPQDDVTKKKESLHLQCSFQHFTISDQLLRKNVRSSRNWGQDA